MSLFLKESMDYLLSLLIRCIIFFSGFAKPLSKLGLTSYEEWKSGRKRKILLVGYNGARNTGSDARVVAITEQLIELFGTENIQLTVMTLQKESLEGYFAPEVELLPFSSVFVFDLLRACNRSHAAILCEGSTLKSTFANALTLFLCEAAGIMGRQKKPCLAYGSEVGEMEGFLKNFASTFCKDTYFITRTEESTQVLTTLGLKGHTGTDTAWHYTGAIPSKQAKELLRKQGWDGVAPLLGIAVINPYCWPVRASLLRYLKGMLTRNLSGQYDKWYFFSDSPARRKAFDTYLNSIAGAVNTLAEEQTFFPVLLGMERLDEEACLRLQNMLHLPSALFLSKERDAGTMTGILRELSCLLTSRYHALVLSMERSIPVVAVSMDERLDRILTDLSLSDYLLHVSDENLQEALLSSLHKVQGQREEIQDIITKKRQLYKQELGEMGNFLLAYLTGEENRDR